MFLQILFKKAKKGSENLYLIVFRIKLQHDNLPKTDWVAVYSCPPPDQTRQWDISQLQFVLWSSIHYKEEAICYILFHTGLLFLPSWFRSAGQQGWISCSHHSCCAYRCMRWRVETSVESLRDLWCYSVEQKTVRQSCKKLSLSFLKDIVVFTSW